jgi:arylformamidase
MEPAKDPFRTRDHVANFDEVVGSFVQASAATRARHRFVSGILYGPGEGETLDLFLPEKIAEPIPVHVFVHGGYWRMFAKEDFSFVAETVLAKGAIAVVIDYALMPSVRLAHIVDQVRRAVLWVGGNIGRYGGDPAAISVSGHSAGAHLCCWLLASEGDSVPIRAALLVSGVYDLVPLRDSFLKDLIALTQEEAERWSPLHARFTTDSRVSILVGQAETEPFHDQAGQLVRHLAEQGVAATSETLADMNHMTIVRDLGRPGTAAAQALARILAAAAEDPVLARP